MSHQRRQGKTADLLAIIPATGLKPTGVIMKTILCVIIAALALAGCNTVQGIGKDVKKGGEAIEKAAK